MKKIVLIFVFVLFRLNAQAQPDAETEVMLHENRASSIHLFTNVDKHPMFGNDIQKFNKFFAENFVMPETESENLKFTVSFVVEVDGTISDIILTQRVDKAIKQEIDRVVLLTTKKWSPAENNGEKVRCQYNLPLNLSN
jgi:periplasmic protein TonB